MTAPVWLSPVSCQTLVKTPSDRVREAKASSAQSKGVEEEGGGAGGGGVLVLTAPIGPDLVVWNLERRYGVVRLPLLLEGWDVLGRFGWLEEKLTQEANFRQRFEPAWVLTPNTSPITHAQATHDDL